MRKLQISRGSATLVATLQAIFSGIYLVLCNVVLNGLLIPLFYDAFPFLLLMAFVLGAPFLQAIGAARSQIGMSHILCQVACGFVFLFSVLLSNLESLLRLIYGPSAY